MGTRRILLIGVMLVAVEAAKHPLPHSDPPIKSLPRDLLTQDPYAPLPHPLNNNVLHHDSSTASRMHPSFPGFPSFHGARNPSNDFHDSPHHLDDFHRPPHHLDDFHGPPHHLNYFHGPPHHLDDFHAPPHHDLHHKPHSSLVFHSSSHLLPDDIHHSPHLAFDFADSPHLPHDHHHSPLPHDFHLPPHIITHDVHKGSHRPHNFHKDSHVPHNFHKDSHGPHNFHKDSHGPHDFHIVSHGPHNFHKDSHGPHDIHIVSHGPHDFHKDSHGPHDFHKDSHGPHDFHKDSHGPHDFHKFSHGPHDFHKDSHVPHDFHKFPHHKKGSLHSSHDLHKPPPHSKPYIYRPEHGVIEKIGAPHAVPHFPSLGYDLDPYFLDFPSFGYFDYEMGPLSEGKGSHKFPHKTPSHPLFLTGRSLREASGSVEKPDGRDVSSIIDHVVMEGEKKDSTFLETENQKQNEIRKVLSRIPRKVPISQRLISKPLMPYPPQRRHHY